MPEESSLARNSVRARHLVRCQVALQALGFHHLGLVVRRHPQPPLALGQDGARQDAVDPHLVLAPGACQGFGHRQDGGLGGGIGGELGKAELPGDGAHIDDRPAAGLRHAGRHRLGGEELVIQIDRHAAAPVLRRDLGDLCRSSLAALLTSTRIVPSAPAHLVMAVCRLAMSVMSQCRYQGRGAPVEAIRSHSAIAASSARSMKPTRAPWAAKCSTREAPMPLAPPLMKTVRSRRLG